MSIALTGLVAFLPSLSPKPQERAQHFAMRTLPGLDTVPSAVAMGEYLSTLAAVFESQGCYLAEAAVRRTCSERADTLPLPEGPPAPGMWGAGAVGRAR